MEEGACSSFAGGNGNTIDFDNEAQTVVDQLTSLSDFTRGDLTTLKNNFQTEFFNAQVEVNLVVDKAQSYARLSYYAIAVIFLSTLLSIGGYMAWFGPKIRTYFFVQSWIVLPLYFVVLIMTAIITGAISAAMVVNSGKFFRFNVLVYDIPDIEISSLGLYCYLQTYAWVASLAIQRVLSKALLINICL